MGIDFKKLLPSNIRTGRWGELMEVIQSVFTEIKTDKIDIIQTQFVLENMTDEQILGFGKFLGYDINYRDGYTSTLSYLRKELLSIVPRISNRTTSISYDYIFNNFNLTGNVYPCFLEEDLTLNPFIGWKSSNESDTPIYMDQEADNILYYIDGNPVYADPASTGLPEIYLDPEGGETPTTLDENTILSTITRHILVEYKFNFIESEDEFISTNTVESYYSDLFQNKRRTEVLHLEPKLTIDTHSGSINNELYVSYDETLSGYVTSKHQACDLSSGCINTIEFGNGEYETISGVVITGVNNLVASYNADEFKVISQGSSRYNARKILTKTGKFIDFTEFALIDTESECIYYAHLPEINYSNNFYSSIQLDINLV
ncbi:MAG: hypothetical protein GY853_09775 [PVC group bacterium]|nr:hypothetical protein [PVC group bacterium]